MIKQHLTIRSELAWLLTAVMSAAFISLFISFEAGALSLLFMAAAWWTWQHPENGFQLLLVILPILPMFKITQTIGTITLLKDVIIITLFVRQFLWPFITQTLPYRRNALFLPIAALTTWTVFEVFQADALLLGILRARDILLYLLLYFAVLYLPHSWPLMKERARLLIYGFAITLVLSVYQWYFAFDSSVLRFDPVRQIWIPRLSSTLGHPSVFGQYLIVIFCLLAAYSTCAVSRLSKTALLLLAAATVPAIFLTYSRAVWLGLAVAAVTLAASFFLQAYYAKQKNMRKFTYAACVLVIIVIALGPLLHQLPLFDYVRSFLDPAYQSNAARLEFLARLLASQSNSDAIFGKGLGDVLQQNFRTTDLALFDVASGSSRAVQLAKNSTLVDNQYLKTWVEMGLIGLLIYLWLYWTITKSIWSLYQPEQKSTDNNLVRMSRLWMSGFLAAFIVQAFFIDIWDVFPTNALFWIVAAFVSAAQTPTTEQKLPL